MPPPASHRLDLLLLAPTSETPGSWAEGVIDTWREAGFLLGEGPGPRELVAGGFLRVWAEVHDHERFHANRQGGFRVRCPRDAGNVVPAFNPAMSAWRAGRGPRSLRCPTCGEVHDLAALDYQPPAGFARGLVVIAEAEANAPSEAAMAAILTLGAARLLWRRG